MTSRLRPKIDRLIEQSGSIPLAQYLHLCMADPTAGYYAANDSIGKAGDFITAPEVSQMFGELLGIWVIETWKGLGSPSPFTLAELGPGNGTMMSDIFRAAEVCEEFLAAAELVLVETSSRLIERQRRTIKPSRDPVWTDSIANIPDQPVIVLANELLDALPISQYVKKDGEWHERVVILAENDELAWALSPDKIDKRLLPGNATSESNGSVYEISPGRELLVTRLCELIKAQTGAVLLIDYGHTTHGFGDTLQAVRAHEFVDPLANPGQADISSHVDFEALCKIVEKSGLYCPEPVTQGEFLLKLGLLERAGSLGAGLDETGRSRIKHEAERLALPDQMGNLFKVMAFTIAQRL